MQGKLEWERGDKQRSGQLHGFHVNGRLAESQQPVQSAMQKTSFHHSCAGFAGQL